MGVVEISQSMVSMVITCMHMDGLRYSVLHYTTVVNWVFVYHMYTQSA